MSGSPASAVPLVAAPRRTAPFDDLLRAHRRELLVHCYRMLGSWTEAEDVFQEVSLRAWRGFDRFEARSSPRSWLYRIATNACLSARRSRVRRSLPEIAGPAARAGTAPAPPVEEARWVQPFPTGPDVEAVASSRETVSLAFVLALQHLPPRQRAALLLRDVIGYEAGEVAAMLDTSVDAVHSAIARARARLARVRARDGAVETGGLSATQQRTLARYVRAWEAGDVDGLVALLSRDAIFSMPPFETWFRGRAAIARWLVEGPLSGGRRFRVFPTHANGEPAFAFYSAGEGCAGEPAHEGFAPHSIQMVSFSGPRIARMVNFLGPGLVRRFGFGDEAPRPASKK